MAAFFWQIGGCEVHRQPLPGKRQTHRIQRRAHPFARFRHRFVGQADNGEKAVAAFADMDLNIDLARLDAGKGHGVRHARCS